MAALREMVPESTVKYLQSLQAVKIAESMNAQRDSIEACILRSMRRVSNYYVVFHSELFYFIPTSRYDSAAFIHNLPMVLRLRGCSVTVCDQKKQLYAFADLKKNEIHVFTGDISNAPFKLATTANESFKSISPDEFAACCNFFSQYLTQRVQAACQELNKDMDVRILEFNSETLPNQFC